MLVKCPKCKTTYKVSDEVVKGTTPAFRCSRCKHTFELQEQKNDQAKGISTLLSSSESDPDKVVENELSFKFAAGGERQDSLSEKDKAPSRDFSQPSSSTPTADADGLGAQWAMARIEGNKEVPFTISESPEWEKDDDFIDRHGDTLVGDHIFDPLTPPAEGDDNIFPLAPYRDQQASTLPYMTLFALLIICFSLLTALHITYPETSQAIIKTIPVLGSALVRNTHLKNGLALKSVHGSYQTIQGNREVFVVTGVAMNQNPVVIREVRIGGQTYNGDGKSIEEQSIWVGNALSSKIIRGMTPQDISDLQRLKPLKSFEIPPGDSIPFTIVFLKPAKAIKEFSCEVLGVEGEI